LKLSVVGCAHGKIKLLTANEFRHNGKDSSTFSKYGPFNANEFTSIAVFVVTFVAQTAGSFGGAKRGRVSNLIEVLLKLNPHAISSLTTICQRKENKIVNKIHFNCYAVVFVAFVAQTAGHSAELNVVQFSTLRKFS